MNIKEILINYLPLPIASIIEEYENSEVLVDINIIVNQLIDIKTLRYTSVNNNIRSLSVQNPITIKQLINLFNGKYNDIFNINFNDCNVIFKIHTREELIHFKAIFANGTYSSTNENIIPVLFKIAIDKLMSHKSFSNYYSKLYRLNKYHSEVMEIFLNLADIIYEISKVNMYDLPILINDFISDIISLVDNKSKINIVYNEKFNNLIGDLIKLDDKIRSSIVKDVIKGENLCLEIVQY